MNLSPSVIIFSPVNKSPAHIEIDEDDDEVEIELTADLSVSSP